MSREFWHKILGLFGCLFSRGSWEFGGRGGEGTFSTFRRGSSNGFEAHPGTPCPSAPYSPSFLTTEGKHPGVSRGQAHIKSDERILGDSDLVDSVLAQAEEHYTRECELRKQGYDLEKIAERVAEIYGIDVGEVLTRDGQRRRVDARSLFCFWAVLELGNSLAALAVRLGMSPAGIGYAVQRGEAIAHRNGYELIP
jgi:hypothetical protein